MYPAVVFRSNSFARPLVMKIAAIRILPMSAAVERGATRTVSVLTTGRPYANRSAVETICVAMGKPPPTGMHAVIHGSFAAPALASRWRGARPAARRERQRRHGVGEHDVERVDGARGDPD